MIAAAVLFGLCIYAGVTLRRVASEWARQDWWG